MAIAPALSTEPVYYRVEQKNSSTGDLNTLGQVYHVDQIAEHVATKGYKSPCLQFPDHLVRDSAQVATLLQEHTGIKFFVLADTSYSPCCADEVSAQHVHGDVVFHFGSACLNPTRTLPVVYVPKMHTQFDTGKVTDHFEESKFTLVFPDTNYIEFAKQLENVCVALPAADYTFIPPLEQHSFKNTSSAIPHRVLTKPLPADLSEVKLVYLSDAPSESLALQWSTVFGEIVSVNGLGEKHYLNPAIRRRYRFVQQIKAAGTVGILVNTLSLKGTASLLERTKKAITQAEKKFYVFVVGKPNVAKLGNFEAIDVWVVLGCPQGGIIMNDEEYFKPIVTPYELELAFNNDWNGKWLTQFSDILTEYDDTTSVKPQEALSNKPEDEEPLFDLVTGRFVFGNTPLRHVEHLDLNTSGEVQKSSNSLTIRNTVSTAAEHLQKRTWKGLGSEHPETAEEYAELKKGRSGIARNYNEQV